MIKALRCFAILVAFALLSPIAKADTITVYTTLKTVQMRAGPGDGTKVVATVNKDSNVDGTGNFGGRGIDLERPPVCKGGWCYIIYKRKYGYIPAGSFKKERVKVAECDEDDYELGTCF